jgi:hypothetical protein
MAGRGRAIGEAPTFGLPLAGSHSGPEKPEDLMIILGIILLIVGFVAKIAIAWTIGIILLLIGLVLALLGSAGRMVGPRRHYW